MESVSFVLLVFVCKLTSIRAVFGDSEDDDAATSTSEPTAVQLLSQRLQKAREEYARKLAIEAGDDPDPTVPGPSGQSSSSS